MILSSCTAYGSQAHVSYAMQEAKTENIEIHLHHDINAKDLIAKNFTLNLSLQKDESNNLAKNEDVLTMISAILNRDAESLKIIQLQDVKKYFRSPKPSTAEKIVTLFAYEIPKIKAENS